MAIGHDRVRRKKEAKLTAWLETTMRTNISLSTTQKIRTDLPSKHIVTKLGQLTDHPLHQQSTFSNDQGMNQPIGKLSLVTERVLIRFSGASLAAVDALDSVAISTSPSKSSKIWNVIDFLLSVM